MENAIIITAICGMIALHLETLLTAHNSRSEFASLISKIDIRGKVVSGVVAMFLLALHLVNRDPYVYGLLSIAAGGTAIYAASCKTRYERGRKVGQHVGMPAEPRASLDSKEDCKQGSLAYKTRYMAAAMIATTLFAICCSSGFQI